MPSPEFKHATIRDFELSAMLAVFLSRGWEFVTNAGTIPAPIHPDGRAKGFPATIVLLRRLNAE